MSSNKGAIHAKRMAGNPKLYTSKTKRNECSEKSCTEKRQHCSKRCKYHALKK